jgi:hypothetical protein
MPNLAQVPRFFSNQLVPRAQHVSLHHEPSCHRAKLVAFSEQTTKYLI